MNTRRFGTLVRREFQEHRLLWIAPLATAILMLVAVAVSRHLQTQGIAFNARMQLDNRGYLWVAGFALLAMASVTGVVGGIVAAFYALETLYAERKDRSILFWKSLPVSDAETVLSKFVVITLILPVGVLLLTVLMQPLMALVLYLRFEPLHPYFSMALLTAWASLLPYMLATAAFAILWYAPLAAWLLLASVAMPRVPLVLAVFPALAIPIERLVFATNHIGQFIGDRLFPWPTRLPSLLGPYIAPGVPHPEWWRPFQESGLWTGLAVAAGMLYIVIRLRRYRDDT